MRCTAPTGSPGSYGDSHYPQRGMLLLAIWLIVTGIGGFVSLPIPAVLMVALALIAGVPILLGK